MENGGAYEFGTTLGPFATGAGTTRRQLSGAMASSRSLPHGLVTRVCIRFCSNADGLIPTRTSQPGCGWTKVTVGLWRRRFVKRGLTGLHEELRPAARVRFPDRKVATLIRRTLRTKPKDGTQLEYRALATEAASVEIDTVHRIWRAFGLQPLRSTSLSAFQRPVLRREKVRGILSELYPEPTG